MSGRSFVKQQAKNALRAIGFDLIRYQTSSHPLAKRAEQMRKRKINRVLDVGANTGQYDSDLRDLKYSGSVVSFEPLSVAFATLAKNAARDPLWSVHNYALGEEESEQEIFIAENTWSSSLLNVTDIHVAATSSSRSVDHETIQVKPLDSIFNDVCDVADKILLKIDTQGYEKHVLLGARESLPSIDMIQIELSFASLYDGQPLFTEMYQWLCEHSFQLACFEEPWWDNQTGQLMQIDGVFQRIS